MKFLIAISLVILLSSCDQNVEAPNAYVECQGNDNVGGFECTINNRSGAPGNICWDIEVECSQRNFKVSSCAQIQLGKESKSSRVVAVSNDDLLNCGDVKGTKLSNLKIN